MGKKITVEEITKNLETHVENMFNSEGFKRWLKTLSAFPTYSLNNTLLITMQMPNATKVCGYKKWAELGRQVKKGETGIRIYVPINKKKVVELKDKDGNPVLDDDGKPKQKELKWLNFTLGSVFDISQTEGDDLASDPCRDLDDELDGFDDFYFALTNICPVPIDYQSLSGDKKGYYDTKGKRIVLNSVVSEAQTVTTLVHEMAQLMLRENKDVIASRDTMRVQAEAIAYTVCQHYDFDTSEYSFGYISTWAKDKGVDELKDSMDIIRNTSKELIKKLDKELGIKEAADEKAA